MSKTVSFDINLAPKDPFFETALGKILKWALSVGRYIVIFTEVIVIISFVSRFTLDRQITDLNTSIAQKVNVIESFGDLEDNVRTAQRLIEDYNQISQTKEILDTFPAITEITPAGILLRQLTIRPDQVSISGNTFGQDNLNLLINNLTLSNYFTDIDVNRIETDPQQEATFTFTINAAVNSRQTP